MKTLLLLPVLLVAYTMPKAGPAAPAAPIGEHDWIVDTVHASVVFKVMHANTSWFYGSFATIEGQVSLDSKAPETGKVSITIPVDSVRSNNEQRDAHLRGADFFNSKENPSLTFVSTKIGKKGDLLEVTGDLEIAGKKKSVTLLVEKTGEGVMRGEPRIGYATTFTIKRSDFGMNYGVAQKALGDEVTLTIAFPVVKPK